MAKYQYNPTAALKTPKFGDLSNFKWSYYSRAGDAKDITNRYAVTFSTNKGKYTFVPEEFIQKGVVTVGGNKQLYSEQFLDKNFLKTFYEKAQPVNLEGLVSEKEWGWMSNSRPTKKEDIAPGSDKFGYGWSGKGFLIPEKEFNKLNLKVDSYTLGKQVGKVNFNEIQGIGEKDGQLVYVPKVSGPDKAYGFINTAENSLNSGWIEKKGGFLGDVIRDVAGAFGEVPGLTELTAFIPGAGPLIYAGLKGAQLGAAGKDPLEAGLQVGATIAAPTIAKSVLPASVAAIPGVPAAVGTTTVGLLSGQSPEQAIISGLASGAGSVIGGEVAGATGSEALGKGTGAAATGLLAGGSPEAALIAGLAEGAGTAVQGAINTPSTTPVPTTPGTAGFGDVSDEVYQGASGTVPSVTPGAGVTVSPVTTAPVTVSSNITDVPSTPTVPNTTSTLPTTTSNTGSMDMDDFWNELYAADAAQLATQGIGQDQIAEILQAAGADSFVAYDIANLATQGLGTEDIIKNIGQSTATTGIQGIEGFGASADEVGQGASGTVPAGGAAGKTTSAIVRSVLNKILNTGGGGSTLGRVFSSVLGGGTGGTDSLLSGLLSRGIDAATAAKIAADLEKAGANIAATATAAGKEATVPFTPYTVTSGLGTTTLTETGATTTTGEDYAPLREEALKKAEEALATINPALATETLFGQLESLQAPFRQREQESLLSRLGARGLLGFGQNLPTAGGGTGTVNPYIESLLSAQAAQQAQNSLIAQQFGTSEAARLQALASALQTQGMGIDKATLDMLTTAGTLSAAPRNLALINKGRELEATLKGIGYKVPFLTAGANIQAGQTGMLGQTSKDVVDAIIKEIFG